MSGRRAPLRRPFANQAEQDEAVRKHNLNIIEQQQQPQHPQQQQQQSKRDKNKDNRTR